MKVYFGLYCVGHWYDVSAEIFRCLGPASHCPELEIHATGSADNRLELLQLCEDF